MATKQFKKRNLYQQLRDRDGLTCGICKESLDAEWSRYERWLEWASIKEGTKPKAPYKRGKLGLSIDHIYPKSRARKDGWSRGETWALSNLQLAHMSCNADKGHTYETETEGTEGVERVPRVRPPVLVHEDSMLILGRPETDGGVPELRVQEGASGGRSKKEILKDYELAYNAMAKVWNALPGVRLVWPADRFAVKYCYCKKADQRPKDEDRFGNAVFIRYCENCGYPLNGAWDDDAVKAS